jgi:sensor c-di-GMP phosphodiesterase-like protein
LFTLRKYKWIAAVVGILLAGLPVLLLTSWLHKQGEPEVSVAANASIRITELIIDEAVTGFHELDARGVRSCRTSDVQILQQMVFASASIRELAVVDRNGQTLCTDRGNVFVPRDVIATATTSNPEIILDVVRTAEGNERLLRVRRLDSRGKGGLSALLHVNQLLPRIAPDGAPFLGYARMTLADGTMIGTLGKNPLESNQQSDPIVGRAISKRYGPILTVAMVRHSAIANYDDLRRVGIVFTSLTAFVILACAFVVVRWQPNDPISIIQDALISDEFVPYYQPIIDINSGKLLGAEILVRWRKSDGSIVEPAAFVALLETSDLVRDLTCVLMRRVCAEVGATLATRPKMYIAFNVAPRHISDPAIINDVGSIVEASPVVFQQIVLELTERSELEDGEAAHRVIVALQGLGIRIALDDFGTGRNGLSHIQKLGVDIIKIDKSFVDTITTARQSQAITTTLVSLASALELQVIAEGVETFEQVTALRQYGIDAAQGYIFAPPLPGSAFLELVKALDPQPLEGVADTLVDVLRGGDRVA